MESLIFSDLKFVEPFKKFSNKTYMPYKQVGFFEDKLLGKNISTLKKNLEKRENFIQNYNSPSTFKNFLIKKSNGPKETKEEFENKDIKPKQENKILPNINLDLNIDQNSTKKSKSNNYLQKNNNNNYKNDINNNKLNKNVSIGNDVQSHDNNTGFKYNTKLNLNSDYKNSKHIQAISTKHKNLKIDHNLNLNNNFKNNFDTKSKTTNNSNILKNKIISGHLNKEIQYIDNKGSEISSLRNTLYSNFSPVKQEGDADTKSVMTARKDNISFTLQNKNVSVDCGNDSFIINNNKNKNGSPQKEVVTTKIDFVYKKIFDKKSRMLIEKQPVDKNANEIKKKQKNKVESKSSEFNFNNKTNKKRQYIEEKIEDIKKKIFFIKGVYDFSYPKIIVNKVKTAQDFYNSHHIEQKMKLRESLNNTSQKFLEKFDEKCKMTNVEFRKSFHIEKVFGGSFEKTNATENNNLNHSPLEGENKILKSATTLDYKTLRNPTLTLSQRFINPNEIIPLKILNPISIKTIYPDLGEPSKLKVIHKSKIL